MLKKLVQISLIFLFFFSLVSRISAQENQVDIYFFWSQVCPHCAKERPFLENLERKYPRVVLHSLEISSPDNLKLMQNLGRKLNAGISGAPVPFTVIGDQYFIGWLNQDTTGRRIEAAVTQALEPPNTTPIPQTNPEVLKLPLLGELKIKNLSLPALTFLIALLDGFNPCAMWALLFLISLLLGMKDKTRMWILGTTFIAASGLIYFLFLSAWLNLFLFLGFVLWVRIIVGLIALAAGGYNLRDYCTNPQAACPVSQTQQRQKVFAKLKTATQQKNFIAALIGIILLAFAVNLVELVCSAGLPAIYTQILSLVPLPRWQYYLYLVFYILIFMLDDLIVFALAMITLHAAGLESKYARYSRLIGGILMLTIGLLLFFKPELLMFG